MDEIIIRCQQGDMEAFESLFCRYSTKAVRTAYLMTGRQDIAEDIVQEAFIQCFQEIKRLRNPNAFQPWFNRILIRIIWRSLTREKRKLSFETTLENSEESMPASNVDVERALDAKQMQDILCKALNKLSPAHKTTLVLHYYNDLSMAEIGKLMGCRVGTVKSRLHNARKQMANLLKQNDLKLSFNEEYAGKQNCLKNINEKRRKDEISEKTSTI